MSCSISTVRRAAAALAALIAVTLSIACSTPLDRAWGLSQGAHLAQTIANPEAGVGDLEARRPDGISTDAALYKYRTGEAKVDEGEPPSVVNVDIGG
jgi:hypothetical protein